MIHEIKISPVQFANVWDINQSFIILKTKDIAQNDVIQLREYSPSVGYSGRRINAYAKSVYNSQNPAGDGLKTGYCIVLLSDVQKQDRRFQMYNM